MDFHAGEFAFTLELRNERVSCRARDERFSPLAAALESIELEALVDLVERRAGYSKEGMVGISYAENAPGEIPSGKVLVFCGGEELTLDRKAFEEAAAVYGLGELELRRAAGLPVPAGLDARLRR